MSTVKILMIAVPAVSAIHTPFTSGSIDEAHERLFSAHPDRCEDDQMHLLADIKSLIHAARRAIHDSDLRDIKSHFHKLKQKIGQPTVCVYVRDAFDALHTKELIPAIARLEGSAKHVVAEEVEEAAEPVEQQAEAQEESQEDPNHQGYE